MDAPTGNEEQQAQAGGRMLQGQSVWLSHQFLQQEADTTAVWMLLKGLEVTAAKQGHS